MTVHIIFDDCPKEHGEPSIVAVYSNDEAARRALLWYKSRAPYECQYYTIVRVKVRQ